ncbi:hypothetical protein [Amycolatopsis sp. NBC_00438]|uniref:hypothetical protein n=1 Tax=Amycolatopsis sp. NBC_00438 TaxID=2903558 RepID=UPI002E1B3ED8
MAAWQACFLAGIFYKHVRLGFATLAYTLIWVGLLLWVGALEPEIAAVLVVVEVAVITAIYWRAPKAARLGSSAFGMVGVLLAVVGWFGPGGRYWPEVVTSVVLVGILLLALGAILTGGGKFEL